MFEFTYFISGWLTWLFWQGLGLFLIYLFLFVPITRILGIQPGTGRATRFVVRLPFWLLRMTGNALRAAGRFSFITFLSGMWFVPFLNNFWPSVSTAIRGTRLPIQTPAQAEELRDTLRRGEWRRRRVR